MQAHCLRTGVYGIGKYD